MEPISVLFFGSQGAGKGTQVKLLKEYLSKESDRGIIHIDMGQELRNLRDTGTFSGKLVGDIIDNGIRIYDFMAIYLQTKKLVEQYTGGEHIIADGLARGPEQTQGFADMILEFFKLKDLTVNSLVITDDTAVKRLMARGRNDDTEEAIRKRLAWTKTDVMPQLEYLRTRGCKIIEIDGEPDEATIQANIRSALGL